MKWFLLEFFPVIFWAALALALATILMGCGDGYSYFGTTNDTTTNVTNNISNSEDVAVGDTEDTNNDIPEGTCGYLESNQPHNSAVEFRCEGPTDVIATATCSVGASETMPLSCDVSWHTFDPLCGASTIMATSATCPELSSSGSTDS